MIDGFDDAGLAALLRLAALRQYRFVTPTPATHARVIARPDRQRARTIEDVLGWSLPFDPGAIDAELLDCLRAAGALAEDGALLRSRVRVSSLDDQLYLHSAYPTRATDAIFFGPDSYRFADLIRAELALRPLASGARIADLGTGAGVGVMVAAQERRDAMLFATDINPHALRFARINADAANVSAAFIAGSALDGVPAPLDLIITNPPYIIDDHDRDYRDGGGMHGGAVSVELTRAALPALAPGGRFILYTGSAIVRGVDALRAALVDAARNQGCVLRYREIDPDVFGEELAKPAYAAVDRIALIAATVTRPLTKASPPD